MRTRARVQAVQAQLDALEADNDAGEDALGLGSDDSEFVIAGSEDGAEEGACAYVRVQLCVQYLCMFDTPRTMCARRNCVTVTDCMRYIRYHAMFSFDSPPNHLTRCRSWDSLCRVENPGLSVPNPRL
jgi:hypothetical protein